MKNQLFALLVLCGVGQLQAEQWLDVTDRYVQNPGYDNNQKDGWTWHAASSSTNTDYGCQEFWNGSFEMYQTITGLSNGKYRISVQGFYRNGDASYSRYTSYRNGNEGVTAYLFGNDTEATFSSIYAPTSGAGFPGTLTVYNYNYSESYTVPNTMQSAAAYFSAGNYWNKLEVEVTDGTLQMGVYCVETQYSNWCIFTNWHLEYYATPIYFTSMSFAETEVQLGRGNRYTLVPQVSPAISSASLFDFKWTTDNPSVVVVSSNGELRGVSNGEATVTCRDTKSGLSAQVKVVVSSNEMTASNVIINEVQTRNIDQFIDPSWNYGAWVELYNPSDQSVYLSNAIVRDHKGHSFRLPDDYGSIPAKSFRNLWFDHHDRYGLAYQQVNFKLDRDGGTIILCDEHGSEVTRMDYPAMIGRVSYARTTDGGDVWFMTADASPEASNVHSSWATEQLPDPVVDALGCFFSGRKTVQVSVPAGCTLAYTTDGATPTLDNASTYINTSSATVQRSLSFTTSTVCRFRLFQEGKLPSEVVTRSYLVNTTSGKLTVPVVSVTANSADLFGDEYGVYVRGNGNGRPGNGQSSPCNWNMDWERAVNFEYLVPDASGDYSETVFNQLVDFEMCGGWSRAWEPHSFKLKANKLYGVGNLDYPFFADKPYIRSKTLQLRNGGNDTSCRIKDAALQEIVRRSGLYVDGQAWQPAHVFINGQYRRLLNIREPNNKHFASANYGLDTDYIDQFEISPDSGYVQKSGTKDAFNQWYELSQNCADDAVYQYICDNLVDIEEYINYMAVEFYLGTTDWPQNNVKGFRAVQDDDNDHADGKFHFVLFDLDGALSTTTPLTTFTDKRYHTFDALYGIDEFGNDITGQRFSEEIEFVSIFINMMNNKTFRKRFVDSYCLVAGSVFEPTRCRSIITEMASIMNKALEPERGSCDNTANSLINNLSSSRQTTLINHLKNNLALTGGRSLSLSANIPDARLLINNQEVPTGKFQGTWFGDAKVQALSPAGYRFVGWSGSDLQSNTIAVIDKGSAWHYYGNGSLDGTNWQAGMSSYPSGRAPLGYGKTDIVTSLTGSRPTYYFGKEFTLSADMLQEDLTLDFVVDDGCIVYVNGVEAGRYNMPSGSVSYSSVATSYAPNNPDTGTMTLSKSLFLDGSNWICLEVHNNSTSSTDIYWDASLLASKATASSYVSTDSIYSAGSSSMTLVACFEPVSASLSMASLAFPIKVNEVGAANDIYVNEYWKKNDWIELYNTTGVDINVAGIYVSDNLQKPQKYQVEATSFADNTIIPAGGRLVIWADKLATETQVHTGFKLANEQDAVVLISSSDIFEGNNVAYFANHPELRGFADVLTYGEHDYNQSVGRYPDGGNAIYRMCRPSIGVDNHHTTDDQFLGIDQGISSGSGIETLASESDSLPDVQFVIADGQLHDNAVYYDIQGRRVQSPQPRQLLLRGRHR